jgi:hypothetical protein
LLGFEIAAGVALVLWAVAMGANLMRAARLNRALESRSTRRFVSGVQVNVVPGAGKAAVVLGVVRPRIFVSDELLSVLTEDEQRAVVLHEDHHRSIWAPVRAAAIEAWLPIVGRVGLAKRALLDRLGDLELMADRHALASGCSRAALAAALIKAQPAPVGFSAVSYDADKRIDALLLGEDRKPQHRLAYEWVPVAALVLIGLSCHAWAG